MKAAKNGNYGVVQFLIMRGAQVCVALQVTMLSAAT